MLTDELKQALAGESCDERLLDIYVDKTKIAYQKERYINAISRYEELYGADEVSVFSAPGRSEVGGNHTDHQHGEILAASINLDAIAIVKKLDEPVIRVVSDGFDEITVDIASLEIIESEKETTAALIRGVCAGLKNRGFAIGGFQGFVTSDVLIGAGLSSSAAFETLIGTVLSYFYNDGTVDSVTIAKIGQYAENVYFGKPCGLMDQMACSVGNLVHVQFADPENPIVEQVSFDMNRHGYSLCITDTKGSHADLTAEYAAIPTEMKQVAAFFGKDVLLEVSAEQVIGSIIELRKACGDRAVLRALHFINENERVPQEVAALNKEKIDEFMSLVQASGNSSYKFLQNIYASFDPAHQNVSVALAVSEQVLGNSAGVCRVHGGGFAGTIQAFVRNEAVPGYLEAMDHVFGTGSCKVLKIRKYGGMQVF